MPGKHSAFDSYPAGHWRRGSSHPYLPRMDAGQWELLGGNWARERPGSVMALTVVAMCVAGLYTSAVVGSTRESAGIANSPIIDLPSTPILRDTRLHLKTHPEVSSAACCGYCLFVFDSA